MQGSVSLVPVDEPHRHQSSWHAFPEQTKARDRYDEEKAVSAKFLKTVRIRVESSSSAGKPERHTNSPGATPIEDSAGAGSADFKKWPTSRSKKGKERLFHVHDAILRAYAPTLSARLDAVRSVAPPSEEIATAKALADAMRSSMASMSLTSGDAEEEAAISISTCTLLPLIPPDAVAATEFIPELVIDGSPAAFAVAVDWMYGTELKLTYAEMAKWADDGCELLTVAQDLGIDALEYAIRRAIYEAPLRGGPSLAWAMMQVCERHGLHRELEQACKVIARCAGMGANKGRITSLSLTALTSLLSNKAWIIEDEEAILALAETWMDYKIEHAGKGDGTSGGEPSRVTQARRNSEYSALGIMQQTGRWDVKWGAIGKQRLESMVQKRMLPYCALLDCCKWSDLVHGSSEYSAQLEKMQKQPSEAAKNLKEKSSALEGTLHEMEKADAEVHHLEKRRSQQAEEDAALAGAIVAAHKRASAVRVQKDIALDMLNKAEDSMVAEREASETNQSYKGRVRLSDATMEWRRQRASGSHVQCFLAGALKRQRPRQRKERASLNEPDHDAPLPGGEERFISAFCPWFRRRRCHHVMFQSPSNWSSHFKSIQMERDRVVMRLLPKVVFPRAQTEGPRQNTCLSSEKSEMALFVGERQFRCGRHEMLIRITQQPAADGRVEDLKGFQFGIAQFDQRASREDASTKKEEDMVTPLVSKRGTTFTEQSKEYRSIFAPSSPTSFIRLDEDAFCEELHTQDMDENLKAGSVIDTMLLATIEAGKVRWSVDQIVCESTESSDFLVRHKFLDRWNDERKLEEDLKLGINLQEPETDQTMYAFFFELNPAKLFGSVGIGGSVSVEILPQEAFYRSWWVDVMDRSADGQAQAGEAPENWGRPVSWQQPQ